ncbi:MAG: hypothetical protein FJ225_08685 [Lentisphaerae bacterium]|nr:hypothetical protein [Lentisphaerota bacterium]
MDGAAGIYIVSDLHVGSSYFHRREFEAFLDGLPAGAALVLNGDVLDGRARMTGPDRETLDRIAAESRRRRVVWIPGNHDAHLARGGTGGVEFRPSFSVGKRLFAAHGNEFDAIKRPSALFIVLFRWFHALRIRLGAEPVHVAFYAKKWPALYEVLRRHVARRAVRYAKANGYAAITCGHIHSAEDTRVDGVRYINTGAWTEPPLYWLRVDEEGMELVRTGE